MERGEGKKWVLHRDWRAWTKRIGISDIKNASQYWKHFFQYFHYFHVSITIHLSSFFFSHTFADLKLEMSLTDRRGSDLLPSSSPPSSVPLGSSPPVSQSNGGSPTSAPGSSGRVPYMRKLKKGSIALVDDMLNLVKVRGDRAKEEKRGKGEREEETYQEMRGDGRGKIE